MKAEEDLIFNETGGGIGQIILNRPKALNALSLEMCRDLLDQLVKWASDTNINAVIIKSNSDRAFCAGGDIRLLYENRDLDPEQKQPFFWHEYRLNLALHHFPKPYVSFLDGITMGGGVGISIHGSHPIGTEHLKFAMPESKIGFYPDIGASYFLNHCPGKTGLYLGLTGNTIDHLDAFELGLITHVVASEKLPELEQALINTDLTQDAAQQVTDIINQFSAPPATSKLNEHRENIDNCFNQDGVENIINALQQSTNAWCHDVATALLKRSPTSLKVIFEQLKRAANMGFDEIMQMEFDMTKQFLQEHDFFEGVRACVIDKDQNPHWQPSALSDDIDAYFQYKGQDLRI